MGKIARLPSPVINQIAAGEVIERPASVLKELVENSLDAGASRIRVDIAASADAVTVADDGEGMDPQDALACLERHATSKIGQASDLEDIATLGFRGEALAAIAAVSDVEIVTRARGAAAGYRVRVAGGDRLEHGPAASVEGTTVHVRRIFFNTPARRRFLKTPQAERRASMETAVRLALSRPQVAFEVSVGGMPSFSTPGSGDARAALAVIVGADEAATMLPVEARRGPLSVRGYLAPGGPGRRHRDRLWIVVNGRYVEDRTVSAAVVRAYESRMSPGRFPVALLFLDLEPGLVDVNVHPAKAHVRLRGQDEVFSLVFSAVGEALARAPTPSISVTAPASAVDQRTCLAFPLSTAVRSRSAAEGPAPAYGSAPAYAEGMSSPLPLPLTGDLERLQVLGQLLDTYIVAESHKGLVIVDQHVAHERCLYERLRDARMDSSPPSQQLLAPVLVELAPQAAQAMDGMRDALARVGLEVEPFGPRQFRVRAVPAVTGLPARADPVSLRRLLEELALQEGEDTSESAGELLEAEERFLKTLACHSAVRAGTRLSLEAMRALVAGLSSAANPYTCPHGRPVVVTLAVEELDRLFGRRTPA